MFNFRTPEPHISKFLLLKKKETINFNICSLQIKSKKIGRIERMSELDLENELIAAGQDEETAFYKVSRSKKTLT